MELIDPDNNKTYDKVNITLELKDNNWIITSQNKEANKVALHHFTVM